MIKTCAFIELYINKSIYFKHHIRIQRDLINLSTKRHARPPCIELLVRPTGQEIVYSRRVGSEVVSTIRPHVCYACTCLDLLELVDQPLDLVLYQRAAVHVNAAVYIDMQSNTPRETNDTNRSYLTFGSRAYSCVHLCPRTVVFSALSSLHL